ncbi:MAG: MCP four helix bundle domain-containing protein, partial [Nanoarchaeota archaeon]|nr:MCP four helix bundle domain-containing protein [Nanoarchaeota archaeon]
MNLSKKLVSGFLALSVFSVIVGYVGFVSMKYVDSGIKSLENETIPAINLLKDAKIAAMQVFAATMDFAQARNNTREYIGDAARIQSKAEFISSVEAYRAIIGEPFLEDGEPRDEIKENAAAFIGASDRMFLLKNSGTKDTEIAEAGETLEYARAKLFVSLDSALKHKSEEIKYRGEAVNTTINRSLVSILIIIIVSMISAILSGIIFAHSIADPVIELTRASEEMSGDYR